MHNQQIINNYFSSIWKGDLSHYIYSGFAIADKINPTDLVLDVGCGNNAFKAKIKNLIGIDPANLNADIITTIENFETDMRFNVALCLGSINFGTSDIIALQIKKINSLLTENAKIFWRLNPGRYDHNNIEQKDIPFYNWSFEKLNQFAKLYNFKQVNCAYDTNGKNVRLYAEWIRIIS